MNKTITGSNKIGLKICLSAILFITILFALSISTREYDEPVSSPDQSVLLLKIGRSMGLLAVILLIVSPTFSLKNRFLDRVFSLDRLFFFHKILAVSCLILASLHPLMMGLSKLVEESPSDPQQWQRLLGAIGVVSLWLIVCSSIFRKFLMLEFESWRKLHLFAAVIRYAAVIHVFAIEDDARSGAYAYLLITLLVFTVALAIWDKLIAPVTNKKERSFKLLTTKEVAPEIFELALVPDSKEARLDFFPGQFAYLQIKSNEFAFESHPFTIASSDSNKEQVSFFVKSIGDWSKKLDSLPTAIEAEVRGPFGHFSPFLFGENTQRLILLAGGIGITPFISLLRSFAEKETKVPVLLLWSCKTSKDFFLIPEFEAMKKKLPEFTCKFLVSREESHDQFIGTHLNKESLKELVPEYKAGIQVMLCGPQAMMKSVSHDLSELGYPRNNVHYEDFSYLD